MSLVNGRLNNKNKTVKNLKSLCIKKLIDIYNIEEKCLSKSNFDYVVDSFQKLEPALSEQIFSKLYGSEDNKFDKFLWFLLQFVWDSKVLNFYLKDCNSSISKNWASMETMSEISFIGWNYSGGNIYLALQSSYYFPLKFKESEFNRRLFNYQPEIPAKTEVNHHKLLRLTVLNQIWLYKIEYIFPVLFDLDKGTVYNLCKAVEVLGFPGIKCDAKTYKCLVRNILNTFAFV